MTRKKLLFKGFPQSRTGKPDVVLFVCMGILILFGLFVLSSASSVISFQKYGETYRILFHQITSGLIPGLILFYIFYKVDYHKWLKYNFYFFLASIILLSLVFFPGIGENFGRSQSWVNIFGLVFQPSEIVKFTLILYLAGWFHTRGLAKVSDFGLGFIPFVGILFLILGLVALQPDIGTMMVMTFACMVVYFIAGGRFKHIMGLTVGGAAIAMIIVIQTPHIFERLQVFITPKTDPQNIGYHISQSFLAIGSGGIFGRGFGKSQQKFAYLPEVTSDSIFAVIAEELGFIISLILVLLYFLIIYRAFKIARYAYEPYGRFIVAGVMGWIGFQSFYNIATMIGLVPLTGIPLPFVSAGGTALATSLAAAGILLNISKHTT